MLHMEKQGKNLLNVKQTITPDFSNYSVLMTVYAGENHKFFSLSIESMLKQTIFPEQFVIVCDGVLTDALNKVMEEYSNQYPHLFTIVRLPQNRGTGYASNVGLEACRNELIAKMDSDDIAFPFRCERQLLEFNSEMNLDLVGAYVSEFETEIENVISIRKVPLTQSDINTFAKRRNPFNNQTIMYKKSKAIECGGYSSNIRCEDYEFNTKMIMHKAKCKNIPESLVYYRLDAGAYERRRNWKNTKGFILVRFHNWKTGFSSFYDFLSPCVLQLILFILPVSFTKWLYMKLLRK